MWHHFVFIGMLKDCFGTFQALKLFINLKLRRHDRLNIPGLIHPVSLRPRTSDIPTFFQVFHNKEYDIPFKSEPKTIIDAGSNIGLFTLIMKNQFPDAKIICIEPDPENFIALKKNTHRYENISLENVGLWNKETNLKIHDKYGMGKWGMVVEETIEEGNLKATSIDSIVKKYKIDRIDVLKIDIESSEKQVFLDNYEKWMPITKMIIIEIHDWMVDDCAKPFFVAVNKIYKHYNYSIKGENTIIINNDID